MLCSRCLWPSSIPVLPATASAPHLPHICDGAWSSIVTRAWHCGHGLHTVGVKILTLPGLNPLHTLAAHGLQQHGATQTEDSAVCTRGCCQPQ